MIVQNPVIVQYSAGLVIGRNLVHRTQALCINTMNLEMAQPHPPCFSFPFPPTARDCLT